MATTLNPATPNSICPRCENRLDEITRLKAELSEMRLARDGARSRACWMFAALGVFLLATLPHVPLIGLRWLEERGIYDQWILFPLFGLLVGLPWAQWSFIGVVSMLYQSRLWQRVLVCIALSATAGLTLAIVVSVTDSEHSEILAIANLGPLLTVAIAMPPFVARMFRRWTLAPQSVHAAARPVSLCSYLVLMAVVGIAVAVPRFIIQVSNIGPAWEDLVIYLAVFSAPLVAMGCLHVLLLPAILTTQTPCSISWRRWLGLAAIVAVSCVASSAAFAAVQGFRVWELLVFSMLPLVLLVCGGTFLAAGFYWLRMLDLELVTHLTSEPKAA